MPWTFSKEGMTLPFRRKRYTINQPESTVQVVYLGNVLTIMAKGDNCTDKPLALIWKTHCARNRSDLQMKLSVTRSGLKAETKLQGITEYWAHRITYCGAPTQYPRVFCWIYKHEGKKMKPELRCHAVLCRKAPEPPALAVKLHDTLHAALIEYKREKLSRQNTRLSGMLSGYPTLPRRKEMLTRGAQHFRPPLNRSKSAPKLGMIEEDVEEEEEQDSPAFLEEEENPPTPRTDEDSDSQIMVPGTPRELEFAEAMALQAEGGGSHSVSLPHLLTVDIEIGNDVEKLRLDGGRVFASAYADGRPHSLDTEPDSISDESGYHEKSSLEGDDGCASDSEPEVIVTAL